MISAILHGELGNNLFQLACLLALKEKMNVDYELLNERDSWVSSFRPLEIKDLFEHKFNFSNNYNYNYWLYHHHDLHSGIPRYTFAHTDVPENDGMIIRGYFQSEKYFLNIKEKLINEYFEPKKEVVNYIVNKYGNLTTNSIAIHLRAGGDRPECRETFPLLTREYYDRAISIIKQNHQINNVLVFSDRMDIAKEMLPKEYIYIENESNIVDLIFMSMCSNNVIGNSTYSWWSAYLNKNKDKMVIAPKTNWFGGSLSSLDRKDLFPDSWITL